MSKRSSSPIKSAQDVATIECLPEMSASQKTAWEELWNMLLTPQKTETYTPHGSGQEFPTGIEPNGYVQ